MKKAADQFVMNAKYEGYFNTADYYLFHNQQHPLVWNGSNLQFIKQPLIDGKYKEEFEKDYGDQMVTTDVIFPMNSIIKALQKKYGAEVVHFNIDDCNYSFVFIIKIKDDFIVQANCSMFSQTELANGEYKFEKEQPFDDFGNWYHVNYLYCYFSEKSQPIWKELIEVFRQEAILYNYFGAFRTDVCRIGIVCKNNDGYYVAEKEFDEQHANYKRFDLDLHYGDGFGLFHEKLIARLNEKSKGIVLFYGEPGTGKTFYIRRVIKELYQNPKKKVIVIPNTLTEYIVKPEFLDFLRNYVYDYETGLDLVLIMEDAENLLRKREKQKSFDTVSNILNMTDGIINDLINIQIVASFNTQLENIDSAVMRSQRMLAKKEFRRLDKDHAIKLAEHLGIAKSMLKADSYSTAELYALLEKDADDILIH